MHQTDVVRGEIEAKVDAMKVDLDTMWVETTNKVDTLYEARYPKRERKTTQKFSL